MLKATSCRLNVHPWNVKVRPSVALVLCWPWGPLLATWWCVLTGPLGHTPLPSGETRAVLLVPVTCTHRSQVMGQFEVKGIRASEVKFLDRCETNSGEGALQVLVHRSRMRVRGAKMIRHRRSPATVNHAGQALVGQHQQTLSGPLLPQREIHSLWVQGGVLSQG